jgi:hypothetical protein
MAVDIYDEIALRIIQGQEAIIGPVAIEQARQLTGLTVDWDTKSVTITGDKVSTLEELITKYRDLFGHISVEVSRDAVGALANQLPATAVPESLK